MPSPDWNPKRKLWHVSGCLLMLLAWFLLRDARDRLPLMFVAFMLAMFMTVIDFVRLRSEADGEAFRRMFGGWLRDHEDTGFNSSFYYLWGGFVLTVAASDAVLVTAVLILGLADPGAAWVRVRAQRRGRRGRTLWGFCTFAAIALLCVAGAMRAFAVRIDVWQALFIAVFVAVVESFTKNLVALFHPFMRRVRRWLRLTWVWRLYPDDNFTILVATAAAAASVRVF